MTMNPNAPSAMATITTTFSALKNQNLPLMALSSIFEPFVIGALQLPAQRLHGVVFAGKQRVERNAGALGHHPEARPVDLVRDEYLALVRRQPIDRGSDLLQQELPRERSVRSFFRRQQQFVQEACLSLRSLVRR